MKIKICGLTRLDDIHCAIENGANFLGFIFVPDTPRVIDIDEATALIKDIPDSVNTVAVILSGDPKAQEYLDRGFDYLQVYGGVIVDIDRNKQIPVYHVSSESPKGKDDKNLKLFDTKVEGQLGGSGQRFDLSLLAGALEPYFVAGGFKPGHLQGIKELNPFAVDVSSGVEAEPRIKDKEKIKAFVKELRGEHK